MMNQRAISDAELLYLDYNCFQRGMETTMRLDDAEVRVRGIDVLNRALGPVLAYRFLTLMHREPTDYVEISRRLYANQTIDDIFERAQTQWQG
jgi:hypothetical protein